MTHPSLIEFTVEDDRKLVLVFQDKGEPLLKAEFHNSEVWPSQCPDDGTLFLEGKPEDYVDRTFYLEAPEEHLQCTLAAGVAQEMSSAETCCFGNVMGDDGGGIGPGFLSEFHANTDELTARATAMFQAEQRPGRLDQKFVSRQALGTASGVVVLIGRPQQCMVRKYFDKDDPSVKKPKSSRSEDAGVSSAHGGDIDMGDDDGLQDQSKASEEDSASKMRTVRLNGS